MDFHCGENNEDGCAWTDSAPGTQLRFCGCTNTYPASPTPATPPSGEPARCTDQGCPRNNGIGRQPHPVHDVRGELETALRGANGGATQEPGSEGRPALEREALAALRVVAQRHGLKGCDGGASDEPCMFPSCIANGCDGGGGGEFWNPPPEECIEDGCKREPLSQYLYCLEHLNIARAKDGLPLVDERGRQIPGIARSPTTPEESAAPTEPHGGATKR
jgi:hypothetical protein